ncbi:MAG: Nif3-like dinuclear metal center hexameric protein [Clostridia bacterium]|nr:Nif3-like dinuclear metal center hexameric protein [Clostridia bacterium]
MKAIDLYKYLDAKIPSSLSCTWDNDGLMCCGDPNREIKKVLITLDITDRAVDKATEEGFDTIISHHPLIFKKIGAVEPSLISAKKAIKLIKNDITAMSFHTRLDAKNGGVNDILCSLLEIKDPLPFGPVGEEMGRIGTLSSPMSLNNFCLKVKNVLGAPVIFASGCGKIVQKVALLGGDGKDFVTSALEAGADTYISGRLSYNIMEEAPELSINLIEAGHFYTEDPVCKYLAEIVNKACPEAVTEIYNSNEIKVF